MSTLRIATRRTVGYARNAYTTAFVFAAFLAVTALLFALRLNAAEGGTLAVSVIWATSIAPALPFLAAFLGMDAWSEERRSGRLSILLTSPVSVWDMTLGKFIGVWLLSHAAIGLSLVSTLVLLHAYAPACRLSFTAFGAAYAALAIPCTLACAVAVAMSALTSRAAIAATCTALLLAALPYGIWAGLRIWSMKGACAYGEMPLIAHVIDLASGTVALGTLLVYILLTALALFVATTAIERTRLIGRGGRRMRAAADVSLVLAGILAALSILLVLRVDVTFYPPVLGKAALSERTLGILADSHGEITATCFLPRKDARFRPLARTLRLFSQAAAARGGLRLNLRFVDPNWDLGEAARLVRAGVQPGSVQFAYARRKAVLPIAEGIGERLCASTILRLTTPPQHRNVHWSRGHGETAFDDYGPFGMSDIARELSRDGYLNQPIDLTLDAQIPSDCALIVVAGAREDFSRTETARLDAYLKQGGRLLVLSDSDGACGLTTLLSGWGINVTPRTGAAKTINGTDVIVSSLADHPITTPLKGARLVLEKPVAFVPSAIITTARTADRIVFTPLARAATDCVAALVERGKETGDDLAFRPTRIIAIGDSSFVMNGALALQANANRDFFLNAVACLSGTDAMTSGGMDDDRLQTGMDRVARRRFAFFGASVMPIAVLITLALVALRRKHRT